MDDRFKQLDTNKIGAIVRADVDTHAMQRFSKLDFNNCCAIERDVMRIGRRCFGMHNGGKRGKRGKGPDGAAGSGGAL
jgi:hypothetical protein